MWEEQGVWLLVWQKPLGMMDERGLLDWEEAFLDATFVSAKKGALPSERRHLVDRYGVDEVATWYFEVWNEPNIDFWGGIPRQRSYFQLYDHTAGALKQVNPPARRRSSHPRPPPGSMIS